MQNTPHQHPSNNQVDSEEKSNEEAITTEEEQLPSKAVAIHEMIVVQSPLTARSRV